MKMNKIICGAAALFAGALLSAQQVIFGGYNDYSVYPLGQDILTGTDGTTSYSDPAAEVGSWYNGRTEFRMTVNAANFQFNGGVRLNASLGTWYGLYYDSSDSSKTATYFYQGNVRVGFLNDQLFLYTGKFEEWNGGYIQQGYAFADEKIRAIADRGVGEHMTALEWAPYRISGFKCLVALPIIPGVSDGVEYLTEENWSLLYKKLKFAASYKWLRPNILFTAGIRPGTYYDGVSGYDGTTNYFGEGWFQTDLPTLIPGIKLRESYDIRWRKNDDTGKYTTAHYLGISAQMNPIPNFTLNVENQAYYAAEHYVKTNEELFYDKLGFGASYPLKGTPYTVGLNMQGMYSTDANGCEYTSGSYYNWSDDFGMSVAALTAAAKPGYGMFGERISGHYYSVYANPYISKGFSNGVVTLGFECLYSYFTGTGATSGFSYRIPLNIGFWF